MLNEALTVAFRADASLKIGTGHVMRCLTLADELARQGHQCLFICRDHSGHLGELITRKGFELHFLANTEGVGSSVSTSVSTLHANLLGVSWQQDARQTLELLASLSVDWLVVDHYALDASWEREVATVVSQIMVIDDLEDRAHQADVLLDQNVLSDAIEERYKAIVNSECKLLLGPHYALLGQDYRLLANALPERDGCISRILIFVGGSDPHHMTERYLKALSAPEFRHLMVDVVIGSNHPEPDAVSDLVSCREGSRVYSALPSLSVLMVRADLMLGAGGTTNWERMCLGLNSIVVSVASNQDEISRILAERGLIQFLGNADAVNIGDIRSCLRSRLANVARNRDQSKAMRGVVSGRGADYVIQELVGRIAYDAT